MSLAVLALALLAPPQSPIEETLPDGRQVITETIAGEDGEPVRHGSHSVTAADGTELVRGEFDGGQRSDRWVYRHPNGEIAARGKYRSGERVGPWTSFWPNGEKRARGKFRAGKFVDKWTFHDVEGKVALESSVLRVAATNPKNDVGYEGWIVGGKLHGPWTLTWIDGSSLFHGTYEFGRLVEDSVRLHVGGVQDGALLPDLADSDEPLPFDPIFVEPTAFGAAETSIEPVVTGIEAGLAAIAGMGDERARERWLRSAGEFVENGYRGTPDEARDAARWALSYLAGIQDDGADPDDLEDFARSIVDRAVGDPPLGWKVTGEDGAATGDDRMAILRAHTRFRSLEDWTAYWSIDAQLPPRTRKAAPRVEPVVSVGDWIGTDRLDDPALRVNRAAGVRPFETTSADAQEAIADGAHWLARSQSDDGGWDSVDRDQAEGIESYPFEHRVGVSSLAAAALVRAGMTPSSNQEVAAALRFLIRCQSAKTGQIYGTDPDQWRHLLWLYDHSMATWVLAEALERDPTPRLRAAVEAAVPAILDARNAYAVWRYEMPPNGENDTSVTFWAMRALVAAERAGVQFDEGVRADTLAWVDKMTDERTARVGYVEAGSTSARMTDVNHQFPVTWSEALTAGGILLRFWCGEDPVSSAMLSRHVDLLKARPPAWKPDEKSIDYYYWLLGAEAMQRWGGPSSRLWLRALGQTLLGGQRVDGDAKGSWDPLGPWCFAGGRVYATSMATLALSAERSVRPTD
ncbi:MAG: hypothetical protein AAF726_09295 [Planctomycetota bacterium]